MTIYKSSGSEAYTQFSVPEFLYLNISIGIGVGVGIAKSYFAFRSINFCLLKFLMLETDWLSNRKFTSIYVFY